MQADKELQFILSDYLDLLQEYNLPRLTNDELAVYVEMRRGNRDYIPDKWKNIKDFPHKFPY